MRTALLSEHTSLTDNSHTKQKSCYVFQSILFITTLIFVSLGVFHDSFEEAALLETPVGGLQGDSSNAVSVLEEEKPLDLKLSHFPEAAVGGQTWNWWGLILKFPWFSETCEGRNCAKMLRDDLRKKGKDPKTDLSWMSRHRCGSGATTFTALSNHPSVPTVVHTAKGFVGTTKAKFDAMGMREHSLIDGERDWFYMDKDIDAEELAELMVYEFWGINMIWINADRALAKLTPQKKIRGLWKIAVRPDHVFLIEYDQGGYRLYQSWINSFDLKFWMGVHDNMCEKDKATVRTLVAARNYMGKGKVLSFARVLRLIRVLSTALHMNPNNNKGCMNPAAYRRAEAIELLGKDPTSPKKMVHQDRKQHYGYQRLEIVAMLYEQKEIVDVVSELHSKHKKEFTFKAFENWVEQEKKDRVQQIKDTQSDKAKKILQFRYEADFGTRDWETCNEVDLPDPSDDTDDPSDFIQDMAPVEPPKTLPKIQTGIMFSAMAQDSKMGKKDVVPPSSAKEQTVEPPIPPPNGGGDNPPEQSKSEPPKGAKVEAPKSSTDDSQKSPIANPPGPSSKHMD